MEKNQRYQKINQVFMVLYLLVCLWGIVDSFLHSTPYYMGLSLLSPLFLLIPPLFWRITRLKPAHLVSLTVNLFSFLAFVIGIAFRGYGRFPFYDKAVHTLSGVLFGLLGVIFYYLMKKDRAIVPRDGIFAGYFAVSFACTIGMLWEVWEYSMDFIFHSDPQHVLTTGVHDTMQDMIVCLIGSLFVLFSVWRYYRKGKAGPIMRIFLDFYELNLKKEQ